MKKFLSLGFVILISLMVVLPSCSRRVLDFTIVSTRNINLSKIGTFVRSAERTDGYDVKHILIFVPFSMLDVKLAIDRAIDAVPGCVALVDCVVHTQGFWALIYGQVTMIAEGTPIIDPSLLTNEKASLYKDNDYLMVKLDRKGKINKVEPIDKKYFDQQKAKMTSKETIPTAVAISAGGR